MATLQQLWKLWQQSQHQHPPQELLDVACFYTGALLRCVLHAAPMLCSNLASVLLAESTAQHSTAQHSTAQHRQTRALAPVTSGLYPAVCMLLTQMLRSGTDALRTSPPPAGAAQGSLLCWRRQRSKCRPACSTCSRSTPPAAPPPAAAAAAPTATVIATTAAAHLPHHPQPHTQRHHLHAALQLFSRAASTTP